MNRVTAGRFKNKRVSKRNNALCIRLGWRECLPLTPAIVAHIQIISTTSAPSAFSGFWRGLISNLCHSRTLWLSSILSAKHKNSYTLKITYRDNTSSVMETDQRCLAILISNNILIS